MWPLCISGNPCGEYRKTTEVHPRMERTHEITGELFIVSPSFIAQFVTSIGYLTANLTRNKKIFFSPSYHVCGRLQISVDVMNFTKMHFTCTVSFKWMDFRSVWSASTKRKLLKLTHLVTGEFSEQIRVPEH